MEDLVAQMVSRAPEILLMFFVMESRVLIGIVEKLDSVIKIWDLWCCHGIAIF